MLLLDFQGHRRGLRWTHRLISRTKSTVRGVIHGDFDVELTSQKEALVCRCSSRLVGTVKDICDVVCCPPLPLNGRCGAAVVKNGLGHFCFIVLY